MDARIRAWAREGPFRGKLPRAAGSFRASPKPSARVVGRMHDFAAARAVLASRHLRRRLDVARVVEFTLVATRRLGGGASAGDRSVV